MKTAALTEEGYDLIMAIRNYKKSYPDDIRKYYGTLKDYSMSYWIVKKKSNSFSRK